MDIAYALSTVSAALEFVRTLGHIDRDLEKAELKSKMADLYEKLADVRIALVDAQQDIREKERNIEALKESIDFSGKLILVQGFKYDQEDGKPIGLPYCPACEVRERKFYRLARLNERVSNCPNCRFVHNASTNGLVNAETPPSKPNVRESEKDGSMGF